MSNQAPLQALRSWAAALHQLQEGRELGPRVDRWALAQVRAMPGVQIARLLAGAAQDGALPVTADVSLQVRWHSPPDPAVAQLAACFARALGDRLPTQATVPDTTLLKNLLDQSPSIVAVQEGPDHVLTYANPGYLDMVGNRDVLGRPGREALPELAAEGHFDIVDQVFATGRPYVGQEVRNRLPPEPGAAPADRFYSYVWLPLRDESQQIVGTMLHAVDVTALAQARHAAEQARARYREIIHSIDGVVWEATVGGDRFDFVSGQAERILGYPRDRWLEPGFWQQLLHPADLDRALATSFNASKDHSDYEHEYRMRHADGRVVWVADIVRLIPGPDGAPSRRRGVIIDIDRRKRAELDRNRVQANLLQVHKLEGLGAMAGGIAHDFNNLLTIIMGKAELIQLKLPEDHPVQDSLETVLRTGERAAGLTRQLLAYSGKAQFDPEPLNLGEQLSQMEDLLHAAVRPHINMEVHVGAGVPRIESNVAWIQQLVLNLVINASDAIGDKDGTVEVHAQHFSLSREQAARTVGRHPLPAGNYPALVVVDDGPGMPQDVISRVFDPYFSTKGTGRGLGLAGVSGVVHRHKGAILVDSEPGQGTRFAVLFRPTSRTGRTTSVDGGAPAKGKGLVLLVDDDPQVRLAVSEMLRKLGYTPLLAESGSQALDLLAQRADIEVVLLDVVMPGLDGRETYDRIRAIGNPVPVVLCTGYAHVSGIEESTLPAGLSGFLMKPFRLRALSRAMARAISTAPTAGPATGS